MNTVTLDLKEYLKMRDELKDLKEFISNQNEFILYLDYSMNRQYHIKKTENSIALSQDLEKQSNTISELRRQLAEKSKPEQKISNNFFKNLFKIK